MVVLAAAALSLVCAGAPARAQDYGALMASPDRAEADRAQDNKRHPVELLTFAGVKSGWRVLDMGAGAGYSTELMARAAGPAGHVWGQNDKEPPKFLERLKTQVMSNTTQLVRPFDDPAPDDVRGLDLVTFFDFYHDTTYMQVDRAKMNKAIMAALKPGGYYVLTDWSAKPEDDAKVGKTLHRIAEHSLREEVEAAGFKFVADAQFLRHPEDTRENVIFKNPTPVDAFALKFQKPM
jgi:predicted methyltransferase